MKKVLIFIGLVAIAIIIGVGGSRSAIPVLKYFSPATVTVINATGNIMSDVTVVLDKASARIGDLKDCRQATVSVPGHFSECSTHVNWRDVAGTNSASAGDYMEGCGFYHSTVVVTPDKKAKAIYGRIEP